MSAFKFERFAQDGAARLGRVHTAHGMIDTPAFMPVGTAATVKGMMPEAVAGTGAQIILGNTYHLMLRPGAERVAELGGLHKFMNWPGPILTDSGGFQVMSLSKLRKMTEQGVTFQSHIDGSPHVLTPERAMEIQYLLDSNISMAFDECTPFPATHSEAKKSMELSMRWAERSRAAFKPRPGYAAFGIVQGSTYPDLREQSVHALTQIGFEGYAVGGLAVGEGQAMMFEVLDYTMPLMPEDKPRYLMGVGMPLDIIGAVERGIDMFDCVLPTRAGRFGRAFVRNGEIAIKHASLAADPGPLEEGCTCPACTKYSRAYLHHLFKADEMLGPILLTWHNLHFYQTLTQEIRASIQAGNFGAMAAQWRARQTKTADAAK